MRAVMGLLDTIKTVQNYAEPQNGDYGGLEREKIEHVVILPNYKVRDLFDTVLSSPSDHFADDLSARRTWRCFAKHYGRWLRIHGLQARTA